MFTRLLGLRLVRGVESRSGRASSSARSAFGIRAGEGATPSLTIGESEGRARLQTNAS